MSIAATPPSPETDNTRWTGPKAAQFLKALSHTRKAARPRPGDTLAGTVTLSGLGE